MFNPPWTNTLFQKILPTWFPPRKIRLDKMRRPVEKAETKARPRLLMGGDRTRSCRVGKRRRDRLSINYLQHNLISIQSANIRL